MGRNGIVKLFRRGLVAVLSVTTLGISSVAVPATNALQRVPVPHPMWSDAQFITSDQNPPFEQLCNAVHRRCFAPDAMRNAYNYGGLQVLANGGKGKTIGIFDSFGEINIRHDLGVFNTTFGLPHLCGESGSYDETGNCAPSSCPCFNIIDVQGQVPPAPPPPNNGTGQEYHNLWDLEVALDVEWAHATAPLANIDLFVTPTAETLGVQGFQQLMNAEQYAIEHHMVDVITQSFGSGEPAFHDGLASIKQLRVPFEEARANGVTVFASSGDGGSLNTYKEPVKNPAPIPYPSIIWPASDPLVTAVGGTYLCVNAMTGLGVDNVSPPRQCENPVVAGDREPAWFGSGGGYSILFPKPQFQSGLPASPLGSSYEGCAPGEPCPAPQMRGIPDIAYQASSRTGVLIYMSEPATTAQSAGSNLGPCPPPNTGVQCWSGFWVIGGTSASSPQWAGLIALADAIRGQDVGFINPALYRIASDNARYATDFYDPHNYNNRTDTTPTCCDASKGWDAVTGLGTPNAGFLIPDLIQEVKPTDALGEP